MRFFFSFFLIIYSVTLLAQKVSGTVKDENGELLPNASIVMQGTTYGTNANNKGVYFLKFLSPGTYTLVCQHVGYKREVKTITITHDEHVLDFSLTAQDFKLQEVIVRSGENPANEIIRYAIRNKDRFRNELDTFFCEVYSKGAIRTYDYPAKFLGQKVDFNDGDTSKNKIIFLSETMAEYAVEKPNKRKVTVYSNRVSGDGSAFGFARPDIFSFYEDNINFGSNINPRGYISPIADNAFRYYRYKYEGLFYEEGRQISRIRVIPRRKFEPVFSGYINIVEDEWRIHSLSLMLTKESQMEFLDTLRIEQLYIPAKDAWVMKSQVIYPRLKILGFEAGGSFVNVYSGFKLNPGFSKKYFDKTVLKYLDSASMKTDKYWDEIRPLQLLNEELIDYRKKDSLEQASRNPQFLDSVDRVNNRVTVMKILASGISLSKSKRNLEVELPSVIDITSFNIVEGLVLNYGARIEKRLDTSGIGRRQLTFTPNLRYGFSNKHFNAHMGIRYQYGKKYIRSISISGGKRVFQFNNNSPIGARNNTFASLLGRRNLLKLYEAVYFRGNYTAGIGDGLTWSAGFEYQDRIPLENTTDYSWASSKKSEYTPNYPQELVSQNFNRYQAFNLSVAMTWQPGARYFEFPDQKINIGSKWPAFTLAYIRTFSNLFGSDVDYSKWRISVSDVVRMRLAGALNYRAGVGGFIGNQIVDIPDYHHFNGNISRIANVYTNSFQLLPIYEFSNIRKFYALAHVEYHLNGLLTNKIPLFRKLNWFLVTGTNAFYYKDNNYIEVFAGIENILKIFRFDVYKSYLNGKSYDLNFRIGISGRNRRSQNAD